MNLILGAVFLFSAMFYVWTAGTSFPLSLHAGSQDRYNQLASALLHLHLYVGQAPTALTQLADPYKPELNRALLAGINDDLLYNGRLYFIWGPAPALVLLVPLHLLGYEPSASVTVSVYSIVGLGFALATLRVLIQQIGDVPTCMCAIAGLALSLSSVIPFILRTPSVSEDILAGGYCFTMIGVWLVVVALATRSASVPRLMLMSLCFGLAAGSRPDLGLGALVLIPVYLQLRPSRSRRSLVVCLGLPITACFVLLLGYNQARFHQPLEIGSHYQLTDYDSRTAPLGRLSYALPGAWLYVISPPQPMIVFPFIAVSQPKAVYPREIGPPEQTGGLLPMSPIVAFVAALPWLWRRRPSVLGVLAAPLMLLAAAGTAIMLLAAYELFASTERYEVDFATLFILGGLAAWLSLSKGPPSARRKVLRISGGLLAAWGCATGFATSFFGYGNALATHHAKTWRALEDVGSPLSTAIDTVVGHPVLATTFSSLIGGVTEVLLTPDEHGGVTIVSPGARTVMLRAKIELASGTRYGLDIEGVELPTSRYRLPEGGGRLDLSVRLVRGLNRLVFSPIARSPTESAAGRPVMRISDLSVAG